MHTRPLLPSIPSMELGSPNAEGKDISFDFGEEGSESREFDSHEDGGSQFDPHQDDSAIVSDLPSSTQPPSEELPAETAPDTDWGDLGTDLAVPSSTNNIWDIDTDDLFQGPTLTTAGTDSNAHSNTDSDSKLLEIKTQIEKFVSVEMMRAIFNIIKRDFNKGLMLVKEILVSFRPIPPEIASKDQCNTLNQWASEVYEGLWTGLCDAYYDPKDPWFSTACQHLQTKVDVVDGMINLNIDYGLVVLHADHDMLKALYHQLVGYISASKENWQRLAISVSSHFFLFCLA